jgi:hypothetical protein
MARAGSSASSSQHASADLEEAGGGAVLPTQFFRAPPATDPVKHLMAAVLEDALSCLQRDVSGARSRARRLHREAEAWLMSEADDDVFSFRNICDVLQLDMERLRRLVAPWRTRPEAAAAPRAIGAHAASVSLRAAAAGGRPGRRARGPVTRLRLGRL